jgi:hypothetical protein
MKKNWWLDSIRKASHNFCNPKFLLLKKEKNEASKEASMNDREVA